MRLVPLASALLSLATTAIAAPPTNEQLRKVAASRAARLRLEQQVRGRNQAVAAANAQLLRLDADSAIKAFRKVLDAPELLPKGGGDNSKVRASIGLARKGGVPRGEAVAGLPSSAHLVPRCQLP